MSTIVVNGYLVRCPTAGYVWAHIAYVVGLSRLGHDVWFVEDAGWNDACFDPATNDVGDSPDSGLRIAEEALGRFGFGDRLAFRDISGVWRGPASEVALDAIADADLFIDVGGTSYLEESATARCRVLVDTDPVFTQLGEFGHQRLDEFDHHFTYGLLIGSEMCPIPTQGIEWQPLYPPVLMEAWANDHRPERGAPWTTIASWNTYRDVEYDGITYGHKDVEFMRIMDLPKRTDVPLEVAINGSAAPKDELRSIGWGLVEALDVSNDAIRYHDYIEASRGEFSVAKNAYVRGTTGWFSDRTSSYLAAGRPVVIQETGISHLVDTGTGVLTFGDTEEAVSALKRVESSWQEHSEAALAFATEHLSTEVVFGQLLEKVGL